MRWIIWSEEPWASQAMALECFVPSYIRTRTPARAAARFHSSRSALACRHASKRPAAPRPGEGKTVDLAYEAPSGRLDTVSIAEGVYDYGYYPATPATGDPDGQLQTLTAPGGQSLGYGWDGELPISTTWSGPVAGSVSRSFDDDFRVATESVNGSQTMTFQFDPNSLLDLVDQANGPDLDLVRDPGAGFGAGLLTGTVQGVVATTETPSAFGELANAAATAGGSPLYSLDVSDRDALGRIETKVETIGGVTTTSVYTYEPSGRLDTVTVNGVLQADYAYDANGNRTHEREDLGGPPIAVYDDQDRLLSYAGTTYSYSAAGDLATRADASGTQTFAYDALSNLRSVLFPDGKKIEYGIDGQNRRVGKKLCPAPCTGGAAPQPVQGYLYGDQLRIVAELDASNAVVSRFVYATRPNVPDFMVKGGTTYRILSDQVGSVRLVVNADTGAVAQRVDYDAFGVVTQDTNPGFQPFGFAGGLTDRDTGLVRFGARDYDPRVGRWTSKDPIRFEAGYNVFDYAASDPINLFDPTGLAPLFSYGEALSFYGRTSLQGLAAFADGAIPFADPFAGWAYNPCDPTLAGSFLSGQLTWTAEGLLAYLFIGVPSQLTHFTTAAGARGIMASSQIQTGWGIAGRGVYMTTVGRPWNLFVPGGSSIPISVSTPAWTARLIPRLVYVSWRNVPL